MIVDNEILSDPRVMGEARGLFNAGIEVIVLCPNYGNRPAFEESDGIHIVRFPFPKKLRGLSFAIMNFIPIYVWYWSRIIKKFLIKYKPDIVHVHDLYMIRCAYKSVNTLHIPMVADLHENFPAAIREYEWTKKLPYRWIVNTAYWEKNEGNLLSKADYIVTLSDSFADYLSTKHPSIRRERFIQFPNVPDVRMFDKYSASAPLNDNNQGFNLFYFGVISARRGIITTIQALELLSDLPEIRLILTGPIDKAERNEFDFWMQKPELKDRIIHYPWKELKELPALVHSSSICLSPIEKNEQHESGVANKVFQYMLLGSPLIVSDCRPQAEIVTQSECGLVFRSGNEEDLARQIRELYNNPDMREKMAKNGTKAIHEKYNLANSIKVLIDAYKKLKPER